MIDMPRKALIDVPAALHHIIVRGIDRRKIFFDDSDRYDFLDRLGGILPDSKAACLLNLFGWKIPEARRRYLVFVKKGVENLDRKSVIQARGYDFGWFMDRVTDLFGLTPKELVRGGKQRQAVKARSVLCYWGARELGLSAVEISKKLNIASSTASESVARGRQIAVEQGLKLLDEDLE
jgi:hypothetical protein